MAINDFIKILNGWYWQRDVLRIALQFLGVECDEFDLEENLCKLSDSENLKKAMSEISAEYLTVCGRQICEEKQKIGTGRSVKKEEYLSYYINFENPPVEPSMSVWQKDKILWYVDLEVYNNNNSTIALLDQEKVYQFLEPIYQLVKRTLSYFGIRCIAVSSGRGYNFICSVPVNSPVFRELLDIGRCIEPTLAEEQHRFPVCKRNKPVPWQLEQGFKGSMRLVIFFIGLIIDEARRISNLNVEMSDQGTEGISMDPTFITRSVHTSSIAIPGSIYLKLHYNKDNEHVDPSVKENTPPPIRLIRLYNGHENFPDFRKLIEVRSDYYQALDHLAGQVGYIPDGSEGLHNLIKLYRSSPLYYFHQLMDSVEHDPYWDWWKGYKNIDGICASVPQISHILRNPNPSLLQPDALNYLINKLMDHGMHPKHVAGIVRAQYEDPSNGFYLFKNMTQPNGQMAGLKFLAPKDILG